MTEQALVKAEHGIDSLEKMGKYIAESGLFGVKNPTQAVALMLIAQAEGRHPASAAQDYHIIQGRPSLKSDTMLARFQGSGGKVEWVTYTDTKVAGKFSHPSGGTVTVDWDMERAKKAGLGTKDSWKNYPRAMLRARVISEAIRTVYPAVLGGMYTPEEVMDFEPSPGPGDPLLNKPLYEDPPAPPPPEPPEVPPAEARNLHHEIGKMLMEMCNDNEGAAAQMLEEMTRFVNLDGKTIKGKTSIKGLSNKHAQVVYGKTKDRYEKWLADDIELD